MPIKKKRILIIDDDVMFADTVKAALEDTGEYQVAIEIRAVNAIQTGRAFKPDLILLDLIMPEMDGSELSPRLRQDPVLRGVPIIIVSALVSNLGTCGDPAERDGHLLIGKPVQLEMLMRCIDERLARRG
jgi:two-component system, chemotaxis family, response regulator WspR